MLKGVEEVGDSGSSWLALCPAHDDHNPSLAIDVNKAGTGVLVCCRSRKCGTDAILSAIGLSKSDLFDKPRAGSEWMPGDATFVEVYPYFFFPENEGDSDEEPQLAFEVVRGVKPSGEKDFRQRRPDPSKKSGWTWSVKDLPDRQRNVPYHLPEVIEAVGEGRTLWIAEGERDVEALRAAGEVATCNAGGAGKWTTAHAAHLHGASKVKIVQDKDEAGRAHAAAVVGTLQHQVHNIEVFEAAVGKDPADHLAAGKSVDEFVQVPTPAPPAPPAARQPPSAASSAPAPSPFSDAVVSEDLVQQQLSGAWLYVPGLGGWHRWDERVWLRTDDSVLVEVVREWVIDFVSSVAQQGQHSLLKEASKLLSKGRIASLVDLARGQLYADAEAFDVDPDILVCANGVVDLRTGVLMPHDPDRLVTLMAPVDYKPGARHDDWDTALTCLPPEVSAYMQVRIGQAVTGHTPPDDKMPILQGGGENGKTSWLVPLQRALGPYATAVPPVLLSKQETHPNVKMCLKGARLAVLEESPGKNSLDFSKVKELLGTEKIAARYAYGNWVSFDPTHSLMMTTNHKLIVAETDRGTWRRLEVIRFPFRYLKPHEKVQNPDLDRYGDQGLRDRLKNGTDQWKAALAWAIEGAVAWYQGGKRMPEPPAEVQEVTREWRRDSDTILAYIEDHLEPCAGSRVASQDLLADFNRYLSDRSHFAWNSKSFTARFGEHEWVAAHRVKKGKAKHDPSKLSRPSRAHDKLGGSYQAWFGLRFKYGDAALDPDLETAESPEDEAAGPTVAAPRESVSPSGPPSWRTALDDDEPYVPGSVVAEVAAAPSTAFEDEEEL